MRQGEVYDACFDPKGSEQARIRPIIIVSRDAINATSQVVLAVPCTTHRPKKHIYPSQVLLRAPNGGLNQDSLAMGRVRTYSSYSNRQGKGDARGKTCSIGSRRQSN